LYAEGELIGIGDDNGNGGVEGEELQRGRADPVLDSPSDSYSLLKSIFVKASGSLLVYLTL